jgi:hypothetical protein
MRRTRPQRTAWHSRSNSRKKSSHQTRLCQSLWRRLCVLVWTLVPVKQVKQVSWVPQAPRALIGTRAQTPGKSRRQTRTCGKPLSAAAHICHAAMLWNNNNKKNVIDIHMYNIYILYICMSMTFFFKSNIRYAALSCPHLSNAGLYSTAHLASWDLLVQKCKYSHPPSLFQDTRHTDVRTEAVGGVVTSC